MMPNKIIEVKKKNNAAVKLLKKYPLTEEERALFVQSEKRAKRIRGIEKYKDVQIIAEIIESNSCIAGHKVGDRIFFDSMGRLLWNEEKNPICIRLLNRVWYRLIMITDRFSDDEEDFIGDGLFLGESIACRISCYGAVFPYGDCGQVLMKVFVERGKPQKDSAV
jgi:hypothetical protein